LVGYAIAAVWLTTVAYGQSLRSLPPIKLSGFTFGATIAQV
jgi:hypothetical protein